jgi:hypothetical protein
MEPPLHSRVNFYELLGIDRQATEAEVKKAYRNLVKQYHPDLSSKPDTAKSFQLIQTAYEVLSDPHKRAIYDQLLHRREQGLHQGRSRESFYNGAQQREYAYSTTTAPESTQLSRAEKVQFHLKQAVGAGILSVLAIVSIGLTGLGLVFLFVKDFNGAMVAGYVTIAAGVGLLVNVVKAFRVIGRIWTEWFQHHT